MKRFFHIGLIALAIYIISFPILLGLHKLSHHSHHTKHHDQGETVIQASDCAICDVYENQTGAMDLALVHDVVLANSSLQTFYPSVSPTVSHAYPSLRGPPSS